MTKDYFLIALLYFFFLKHALSNESLQKGPYQTEPIKLGNCSTTTLARAPNSVFSFTLEIDKKTGRVHGNITIQDNDLTNLKLKVQIFLWENEEWHLTFNVPGFSCNRPFIRVLLTAMKLKGDSDKCSLYKGFYSFKNIDVDQVNHLWLLEMDYGKVLSRAEIMDNKHTHLCLETVMIVTPKKKKHIKFLHKKDYSNI